MTPQTPDLFPETLLVECDRGRIYTTSLKVAEHFHKRHTEVLRSIAKLLGECPDEAFSQRNFASANYLDAQGKPRSMYELTEEGFALLAMGFTGPRALRWKIAFLNAFRAMEAQLHAQAKREASALYFLRPHWRTIGQGVASGLSREQIRAQTGHRSADSITRNKRRMFESGLLERAGKPRATH